MSKQPKLSSFFKPKSSTHKEPKGKRVAVTKELDQFSAGPSTKKSKARKKPEQSVTHAQTVDDEIVDVTPSDLQTTAGIAVAPKLSASKRRPSTVGTEAAPAAKRKPSQSSLQELDMLQRRPPAKQTPTGDKTTEHALAELLPSWLPLSATDRAKRVRAHLLAQARTAKLTPLEKQYVDLKCQHPDAVLLLEVGYKYQFFGDDAQIASNVLSIVCSHGHNNYRSASIPVQRLFVHTRRLCEAGYKVGVAKQTETAALKKAGSNKSKPFTRAISALYTQATLIGEDVGEGFDGGLDTNLLCLLESKKGDSVEFALLSVACATGNMVYDLFDDDLSRSNLATRLAHLDPAEMILPLTLSERTEKLLSTFMQGRAQEGRQERLDDTKFASEHAMAVVANFFDDQAESEPSTSSARAKGQLLQLPPLVLRGAAALLDHLKMFKLDKVVRMAGQIQQFTTRGTQMLLNATTLRNLEVVVNATDNSTTGSLLWVVDRTVTAFGRRRLRQWLCQPLLQLKAIQARQDAVEALVQHHQALDPCLSKLKTCPDLDRGLTAILHQRASPLQAFTTLSALTEMQHTFTSYEDVVTNEIQAELLSELTSTVKKTLGVAEAFLLEINEANAKTGEKIGLLKPDKDRFPEEANINQELQAIAAELQAHLSVVRKTINQGSLEYVTVSGEDYLVQVKNKATSCIPGDWSKISATKQVSRFRSPFIVEKLERRSQLQEQLLLGSAKAWTTFSDALSQHYDDLRSGISALADFDCLLSLSEVARQQGYVKPTLVQSDQEASLHVKGGRHPMVAAALADQYVANDGQLKSGQAMLITGPNMGGKSSYIRQMALFAIMAQIGSFVPAEEATVGLVDAIYTRMGASDNMFQASSTFMVELREAAEALLHASPRSLVILDELGRGTSTHDGVAIAYATLKYLVTKVGCMTLFVTHYPSLAELAVKFPNNITCHHMAFLENEDVASPGSDDGAEENKSKQASILFLYQLTSGLANRSYGLNVAKLACLPERLIARAEAMSAQLEQEVTARGLSATDREAAIACLREDNEAQVEAVMAHWRAEKA
eukprot:m.111402 g.111402  ORF g.111402 m.111402 type:complete len:1062 (+) comp15382_c0_seq4:58-3243(+)